MSARRGRPRWRHRCRRAGHRRLRRTAPPAAFCGRPARRPDRFWRGCACPAYRRARCSRRTAPPPRRRRFSPPRRPSRRPGCWRSGPPRSAGCAARPPPARRTRRSFPDRPGRRCSPGRCADSGLCRLAIAAGRPSSRVSRCRRRTSSRSARSRSRSRCGRRRSAPRACAGAGEHHQRVSGSDHLPGRHQSPDRAHRVGRGQHMLHFHRLEHGQLRARGELGPFGRNLDHGAGQLRAQHLLTRIQLQRREPGLVAPRLRGTGEGGKVLVDEARRDRVRIESGCATASSRRSPMLVRMPFDAEFVQRRLRLAHRRGKRRSAHPGDHLGQQRVIARARRQSRARRRCRPARRVRSAARTPSGCPRSGTPTRRRPASPC